MKEERNKATEDRPIGSTAAEQAQERAVHPHRQRVIVTGGAGFIGSHLVERLLAEGCQVTVIDDLSTGLEQNLQAVRNDPRLELIVSRVSECRNLEQIVRDSNFIVHLAAAVGVDLAIKRPIYTLTNNVSETEAILRTAARYRIPVLLASSSEVYGRSARPEFSEEDDLRIGCPTFPGGDTLARSCWTSFWPLHTSVNTGCRLSYAGSSIP